MAMEFDQTYNGAPPVDWTFPSPTATPTHNSFGSGSFLQTPKTSTLPSHFQDAFTTPHFPSYATPQPPHHPSMTPVQRPQTSSEALQSNYYAGIQAVGSQNYGPPNMPPPGQQRDPNNNYVLSPSYGDGMSVSLQVPTNQSFDSTQMQTPPPTRGTSSKRTQQSQQIAFGTPSTIASRRYMTPQQPIVPTNAGSHIQQTPMQFPQLQFSPEMYQFAHIGPASAPVMPQSRIFWDQSTSPMQPIPQPSLDDPFAPTVSNPTWTQLPPQQSISQSMSFDTPAMNSFSVQQPSQRAALVRAMSASYDVHPGPPTMSTGVDPSLLYSSPIRPIVRSNNKTTATRSQSTADDQQKWQDQGRPATISSTAPSKLGGDLRRSNTTSLVRPKTALASSASGPEPVNRNNAVSQILRTASPIKRFGRPSLGSISEGRPRQRTSVILTVDENGTARTETKRVDPSPTRSIRERYPALFDSDTSDAETDTSDKTPSRPSSFIFDKRDERRSKAARLDPPVENLEGLSLPRSASAASMKKGIPPSRAAVAAAASLRRQGSLRRSTPSRNTRRNPASSSATSLIDTAPMELPAERVEMPTDSSSAQNVLDPETSWFHDQSAFDLPPSSAEGALDVYNRRWSMMSYEQQNQPQQHRPPTISPQQPLQPAFSATTPLHHHHHHHHQHPLPIRCVCGLPDPAGHALIQCSSCTQWLHAPCVGVYGNAAPPLNFTCFLCTRPATATRSAGVGARRVR